MKIADLDVVRSEYFGCGQQFALPNIGLFLSFAIEEPIGEEFQFEVRDAVVIEDLLHLPQSSTFENMIQIRVPYSHSLEARFRGGPHAILKVERTIFAIRVGKGSARNRPVGSE